MPERVQLVVGLRAHLTAHAHDVLPADGHQLGLSEGAQVVSVLVHLRHLGLVTHGVLCEKMTAKKLQLIRVSIGFFSQQNVRPPNSGNRYKQIQVYYEFTLRRFTTAE